MTHAATFDTRDSILENRDSMRGPFVAAVTLHAAITGALAAHAWLAGVAHPFGDKDAGGGAVSIQSVTSIPIQHHGDPNPLASDTESEVPQTLTKTIDRAKEQIAKPDAIPLKMKTEKQKKAPVESQHQRFRPYDELAKNQLTSKTAPQISSPLYTAQAGAGRISTGANTTLGDRLSGYAAQIKEIVATHWRTSDLDPRLQTAPPVIATFDLMRNGSIRNLRILQGSGISALDNTVQRAILDSNFPPIPQNQGFDKDYARVEFTFELKR